MVDVKSLAQVFALLLPCLANKRRKVAIRPCLQQLSMVPSNTGVPFAFHRKFLRPRAVRHDAGFEVEFKGMLKVRYSEPKRSVTFWAEPAVIEKGEFKGRHGWIVAISQPSKWDDGTPFLETERDLIQERSKEALRFMGVPCVVT